MAGPVVRKQLCFDGLLELLRGVFLKIPDHRPGEPAICLPDALLSGFALFAVKDPSLLAFDERRKMADSNLHQIFKIGKVPCDTRMREILDGVDPEQLRPAFRSLFAAAQRGKLLERYQVLDGHYLLVLDGTEHFRSEKICCSRCLTKKHRDGRVSYAHQLLAAALVKPGLPQVLPLAPEPILRGDGAKKNDCERNAARRFLARFRREHPHLKVIVVEDALSANGPHVEDLMAADCRFLLSVKFQDHVYLWDQIAKRDLEGSERTYRFRDEKTGDLHLILVYEDVPLNASHQHLLVNVVLYSQIPAEGGEPVSIGSWITDLTIRRANALEVVGYARARWKIENETFNTLKNQGYHFEHNFGHGQEHLATVFAFLMLLAFAVDQLQQACCRAFQAARAARRTGRGFWEELRGRILFFRYSSMQALLLAIAAGIVQQPYCPDTS